MSASPILWAREPHCTVRECAQAHTGRLIDKWSHYFPIYEHHFAKFVGRPIRLLEIGVGHGGSLQLWRAYFGKQVGIWGMDINPACAEYEEDGIYISIGDQAKDCGWFVAAGINFDIIIDDGSHVPEHQSASFQALWPRVNPGGIYLIEDCHNGYPNLDDTIKSPMEALGYQYPWMLVVEKPKRMVIGTPSRPLNQAELEAYGPR